MVTVKNEAKIQIHSSHILFLRSSDQSISLEFFYMGARFLVGVTSFLAEKGGLIHEYDHISTSNNVYVQFKNKLPCGLDHAPYDTIS